MHAHLRGSLAGALQALITVLCEPANAVTSSPNRSIPMTSAVATACSGGEIIVTKRTPACPRSRGNEVAENESIFYGSPSAALQDPPHDKTCGRGRVLRFRRGLFRVVSA